VNIEWKLPFWSWLAHFAPKFHTEGDIYHQLFVHRGQWMPYNFAADSFHTNKLCSTLSSSEVEFFRRKRQKCRIWGPLWGASGQRRLFILGSLESSYWAAISHNWTFFAIDYRVKIAVFEGDWVPSTRNFRYKGRPPPTIHCVRKTTWVYLSFRVRISAELSFVLSQFTRVTDRRTDRHLCDRKDRVAYMQRGKNHGEPC